MRTGWFKFYRKALDNPIIKKDADHIAIWVWLLTEAAFEPHQRMFGKKKITLQPGQLLTSAQYMAGQLHVSESKIKRVLNEFETDRQIEQQSRRYGRLITIVRWTEYQDDDRQDDRQVNDEWTTSERRVNETKEYKECKKERSIDNIKDIIRNPGGSQSDIQQVVDAWNELPVTHITRVGSGTRRHRMLKARLGEYGLDAVIEAINLVSQSPFLLGRVSDFVITFDWFVKPNNFVKVYEGNYSNREGTKHDAIKDFMGGESNDESRIW